MPIAARKAVRVGALSAAAVLAVTTVVGCNGNKPLKTSPGSSSAANASSSRPGPVTSALPTSLTGQKLSWKQCAAPTSAQGGGKAPGGEWECATLKAPLDYVKPGGETIGLALIRAKAKDQGHRIGSLVFNFGGPGGSGITTLPGLAKDYDTLHSRYDLVSFDPRGVGASAGVKCLGDKETDAASAVDGSPDDDAELKAATTANKKYVEACQRNSGKTLPHVDTVSAARDMDLMREVLGDKKLNYFGISYGTQLGGVYAHLFPHNVGRSVLDAVVDPAKDPLQSALGQAKGFQLALNNYMKDCATKGSGCPTGKGGAEGNQKLAALLKKLDKHPLPTKGGRKLTQDQALTGIGAALYNKENWDTLTIGLGEAMKLGQGNVLLALADSYSGRDEQGRYSNSNAANRAISCVDTKRRYTADDVKAKLPEFRKASPVFGESMAWGLTGCTDWPVTGKSDKTEVSAKGSAPIVVIGNTGDPATPYEGARKMARELGDGVGIELTLNGEGHGGYNTGNPCLKKAVDGYLLDGKVPAAGTTCS
ncbi:alpha/beta hydrolase [Streptomyces natalensis]|uniref:Peptidase n=1 Tax=Streptomyces natalensis ATCC 27448 TaxID=1240678 RepID=A0A0D7CQ47_9ACTN|nr:alpha/beta hydrolase [Streptomyces natalensis]KIZ17537.1 peptidase [Streptomyces natalensis ATCC 27448]